MYIHQIFFEEIPTHPTNARVDVEQMARLFHIYDCLPLYATLTHTNELYFKSSSLFPEDRLRYTSLIDANYLMREVRVRHGECITSYQLVLFLLFFLLYPLSQSATSGWSTRPSSTTSPSASRCSATA